MTLGSRADRFIYPLLCVVLFVDAWRLLDHVAALHAGQVSGLAWDRSLVVATALVLAGIGVLAWRGREIGMGHACAIGTVCGLMFFARTLGVALADPTAIGWLLNGDWGQHYSGWAMFRQAPWSWPPGLLPELWHPIGTSIVYTDSLPLLALLLKPLSPWLSEPFQYIGLWLLVNCVLQGVFGALLIARVSRGATAILAGAALFVFAPVFINRIGHDTLTTQWLLLAALWLYFRAKPPAHLTAEAWPWWLLGLAVLVHPYLAVMVLAIQAAYWLKRVRVDRARSRREAAFAFGASLLGMLGLWWLAGGMIIPRSGASGGIAYGLYSFNLLGFFNPMGFSRVLPTLEALPKQYEGFAYAGAGVLGLTALLTAQALWLHRSLAIPREWKPLAAIALVLLLFAASTVLAVGSWVIIDFPIKGPLLGAFRSSGRFVWVAYYSLMLLVLWTVLRRFRYATAAALLSLTLALQLWDFSLAHYRFADKRAGTNAISPQRRVDDPGWARLASGRDHLILLPPPACGHEAAPYLPFQLLAAKYGMTFNSGYLARWNAKATARYCVALNAQLTSGRWSGDDLYILGDDWKDAFLRHADSARCEHIDGYEACTVDEPAAPN